ncbi:PAS domain S-box protein [Desulfopila inferna]|uniref:PAS domain S-box protein n=1 Tax=Desulfopila inferna TaxID=468528 RepID=UPI0019653D22|nr:PAS domain S-box protein [Desulfopila inferna]MBM9603037.1 PAS domain S-box protein [Desulfopila inferna]
MEMQKLTQFSIDVTAEMITWFTQDGRICYANAATCDNLGYEREELLNMTIYDVLPVLTMEQFEQQWQQLREKKSAILQTTYHRKNGSEYEVELVLDHAVFEGKEYIFSYARGSGNHNKTEQDLRKNLSFHRQALESIPGMVFTTRPDGYCDYQSRQWEEFTGVPTSEHLGDGWNQLLHPDDQARALAAWQSAVTGKSLYDLEYRVRRHDGLYVWFRVIGRPIKDDQGLIVRWFGVAMNIEELKQAEQALRESELRYRTVGEAIPYGIWQADLAGACTFVSDSFLEMTGMTLPQLLQFGWLQLLPPEDRQPTREHWLRCIKSGEDFQREHCFRAKDGSMRHVLAIGRPVHNDHGEIDCWVGINLDITERKRAENMLMEREKRLRLATDAAQLGVFEWDVQNDRPIWDNQRMFEIFGLSPQDPPVDSERFEREVVHPKDIPRLHQEIMASVQNHTPFTGKYRIRRLNDCQWRWIECFGKFEYNNKGEVIRLISVLSDITEPKRKEEVLRESEEKFRSIFEQAAVGIGRVSFHDARWIEINDTFSRMLGYTNEELQRIPWPLITHPDDLALDLVPFQKMAAGELESYIVEKRFIHKNGNHVWGRLTLSLVRNAQGVPDYEIAIIEDITERKQAEEALQRSEERWNLALEHFQEGVIIASEDEQIIYWNPAARKMHGFTRPEEGIESLEKTSATYDLLTPDGNRLLEFDEWPMRRIKRGETLRGLELRIRRRDQGWEKVFSYNGTMVDTAGGERLIFLSVHDLTEQRKSEEDLRESDKRLRALTAASSDVLYSMNSDWSEMRRLRSQNFLTDTDNNNRNWLHEYIPLEEQPRVYKATNEAIRTRGVFKLEHRIIKADGSIGWVYSQAVPLLDDKGEILEWFGAANDITERKKAEEALEAANKELEAFSYSVSHDLRAPLRAIIGFSSLLRNHTGQLDGKANEYLQRITAGAGKMNILIDDILRLSRISRQEVVIQEIDLSSMAKAVARELGQQYPERHVEIRIANDLKARGDAQLINIALANLLNNAWKYTGKKAEANIEFGSCQKNGKMVFFLRDNGTGFPMEQAHRLFQPFQRLHSESGFPGTGIGLSIVHRVIKRHGGEIWAEGEIDKEAVFYFTLGT